MKKYNEYEYLYSTARIRALETRIIGNDKCSRMAEMRTVDDIWRTLEENGIAVDDGDTNAALDRVLADTFALVAEIAPDPELFRIQQYPYDCHNVKSAIKCSVRDRSCDELLFDFGSVPVRDIITLDFSKLPENMAAAAVEAQSVYAKTRDPQLIDMLIDSACFMDMKALADKSGVEFFSDMVRCKADLINILTCSRLIRINSGVIDAGYLRRALLPVGKLTADFFIRAYMNKNLFDMLKGTPYGSIDPEKTELSCDNFFVKFMSATKMKIAGAEALAAYITARECEVKNIRIIAAGKAAELPSALIRERLRVNYV